jgi:hypothetical protein
MKGIPPDETASYIRHHLEEQDAPPTSSPTTSSPRSTRPSAENPRTVNNICLDGLRFAIFYTRGHNRTLRPLMACDQPQAPPPLRAALCVIDTEATRRITAACLPTAS